MEKLYFVFTTIKRERSYCPSIELLPSGVLVCFQYKWTFFPLSFPGLNLIWQKPELNWMFLLNQTFVHVWFLFWFGLRLRPWRLWDWQQPKACYWINPQARYFWNRCSLSQITLPMTSILNWKDNSEEMHRDCNLQPIRLWLLVNIMQIRNNTNKLKIKY